MKDRIIKIMEDNNLNASKFADIIGVPRSGLSHIIKGRNKVSLDYVIKILDSFPEVDSNWLLKGEGNYINKDVVLTEKVVEEQKKVNQSSTTQSDLFNQTELFTEAIKETSKEDKNTTPTIAASSNLDINSEIIDKIVIFYKDGTFKSYLSRK